MVYLLSSQNINIFNDLVVVFIWKYRLWVLQVYVFELILVLPTTFFLKCTFRTKFTISGKNMCISMTLATSDIEDDELREGGRMLVFASTKREHNILFWKLFMQISTQ